MKFHVARLITGIRPVASKKKKRKNPTPRSTRSPAPSAAAISHRLVYEVQPLIRRNHLRPAGSFGTILLPILSRTPVNRANDLRAAMGIIDILSPTQAFAVARPGVAIKILRRGERKTIERGKKKPRRRGTQAGEKIDFPKTKF